MRRSLALSGLMVIGGAPSWAAASAERAFTVTNPSAFERPDAIVDLPLEGAAGAWSAQVGGRIIPAQRVGGALRIVVSLAPRQTLRAVLRPRAAPAAPPRVRATLNVRDDNDRSRYTLRRRYKVPSSHVGTDGLIAFEGIGWESDRAGYRIYLDGRNVVDLFGKTKPGIIYRTVGQGQDDYQYPRAWGGDIFKVGASLGVGGIGLLRDGHPAQTGPAALTAGLVADGPVTAAVSVDADAIGGGAGFIHARYAISAGHALTYATMAAGGLDAPLVTGLTVHPGDQRLRSPSSGGGWAYIAVWGPQEHGPDEIGWALFYRASDVAGEPVLDGANLYIRFSSAREAAYAFAGRWTQENRLVPGYKPIADLADFRIWLERQREMLEKPVTIAPVR